MCWLDTKKHRNKLLINVELPEKIFIWKVTEELLGIFCSFYQLLLFRRLLNKFFSTLVHFKALIFKKIFAMSNRSFKIFLDVTFLILVKRLRLLVYLLKNNCKRIVLTLLMQLFWETRINLVNWPFIPMSNCNFK